MMKKYLIGIVVLVAIVVVAIVAVRFLSPEDTWICVNNAWVKHGVPSAPAPLSGRGNSNALAADVYPLYGSLTWGTVVATTSRLLTGSIVTSQPITNISDISAITAPFEKYYKDKLQSLGWSMDNSQAAGRPGSDVTGYKKGDEYIILSYRTVFHGGGANEPVACPCDTSFSVFTGGLLDAGYKNAQYFGNEAVGDLNGDGAADTAFLLSRASGTSFSYYVAVKLKTAAGYYGTNAILLGTNIAPQTTEVQNGELIVNYAERATDGSASVGVSKYFKMVGNELIPA